MHILIVAAFYAIVFTGILIMRHLARADLDQWHTPRR